MKQISLETPTHVHLLLCREGVEFVDGDTIEVDTLEWLEGGRMPVEGRMIAGLIEWGDREGLAEIGIEVVSSVSRASLN